jgi:hypothetical protein
MQMNKLTVTDFSKRNKGYGQWVNIYFLTGWYKKKYMSI